MATRRIYTKDMKIYFLTTGLNKQRLNHVLKIFENYNINMVNSPEHLRHCTEFTKKYRSSSFGHLKMIDRGLREQEDKSIFKPFMIIEDDVGFYRPMPEYIDIPLNCDILYGGLAHSSPVSYTGEPKCEFHLYGEKFNDDITRIYNMLGLHCQIITSALGALGYSNAINEAIYKGKVTDAFTAWIQPYYNVYALNIPILYQMNEYNGCELSSKITLLDKDRIDYNEYTNLNKSFNCYHKIFHKSQ